MIDPLIDPLIDRFIGPLIPLIHWFIDPLIDWLIYWLIDPLIDWLIYLLELAWSFRKIFCLDTHITIDNLNRYDYSIFHTNKYKYTIKPMYALVDPFTRDLWKRSVEKRKKLTLLNGQLKSVQANVVDCIGSAVYLRANAVAVSNPKNNLLRQTVKYLSSSLCQLFTFHQTKRLLTPFHSHENPDRGRGCLGVRARRCCVTRALPQQHQQFKPRKRSWRRVEFAGFISGRTIDFTHY